jgi:hypothetical protein
VQTSRRLMVFGVAALAVTACSNDETSAPTSAAATSVTSVVDTTASATTSPTSTTTTIAATTTVAETTTTVVATEDLIKQAVQDYFEAYEKCGEIPSACNPADFTAAQGPSRAVVTEFATGLIAQGLYFSSDRRGMYLVAESVSDVTPTEASAIYCWYDPGVVMGPNGPDGLPTVVNDVISSIRYAYGLFLEDGVWKVGRQHELERLGDGNLCPPSE